MSRWLAERASLVLAARTNRRGFLARAAVVGSALSVGPLDYLLKPGTAYAQICECGDPNCSCSSACCDGYSDFCCTVYGSNSCPPGTFMGGWWKADGSAYCSGARYYIDCNADCSCGCGGGSFCGPSCDGLDCGCGLGTCDQRQAGCILFRYGQCNQQIACCGRIACRVVTCTPPWQIDETCSTTVFVDEATADQTAPCLEPPPPPAVSAYGFGARSEGGYYLSAPSGAVYTQAGAPYLGSMAGHPLNKPVVAIAATPSGGGYWLAAADGGVFNFGNAGFHGSMANRHLNKPVVGIASTPTGGGFWLAAADGGVFNFGDAGFDGSSGARPPAHPVVAIAATPSGRGYWLVTDTGEVFHYGSAGYFGSVEVALSRPVVGITSTPSGRGYWLTAADGGVFNFGDAPFYGSYPGLPAAKRVAPANAFFAGMSIENGSGKAVSYTLFAVTESGPPPSVESFRFA